MQKNLFQTVLATFLFLGINCLGALAVDVTTLAGNGDAAVVNGTGDAANFNGPWGAAISSNGSLFVSDFSGHTIRKITPAGVVTTFAGQAGSAGSTDGIGTAAQFYNPADIVIDSNDNLFVADYGRHLIRKITPARVVTTFAGKINTPSHINGVRGAATFNAPIGLAIDNGDNIYVADASNNRIRKITPDAVVTTLAGNGNGASYDNGVALEASFNTPYDLVMSSNGSLYVAEYGAHTIRKITSGGVVTTLAGTAGASGSTDDTGAAASFYNPSNITIDNGDNLYVSDYTNHTIRKITSAGVVTTPTGIATTSGSINGALASATYNNPHGLAVMANGAILLADYTNNMLRKIITLAAAPGNPSGTPDTLSDDVVTTLAGNGDAAVTNDTGAAANFHNPWGAAASSNGSVYISDFSAHTIRKVTAAGVVTTFAGQAGSSGSTDGLGTAAQFYNPADMVIDSNNNLFVADYGRHIIRKITPAGLVRTFAGKINTASHIDGVRGAATFNAPIGLAIDNGNNIYVTDAGSHYIRKITPDGVVTTLAGNGDGESFDNAVALDASFNAPYDVVMSSNGSLYVAEYGGHLVRKITSGGVVTTLAGSAGLSGDIDATGSSARFYNPGSITADSSDNLFVTDYGSHILRKVTTAGVVTTASGSSGYAGLDDGPVYQALLNAPHGITITANASVLIADYSNNEVRKITNMVAGPNNPSGTPDTLSDDVVTTLAGNGDAGVVDATGIDANFNTPWGAAASSNGSVYISDFSAHTIRKVTPAGVVTTFAGQAGSAGSTDGLGTAAQFYNPADIVMDSSNNLFVADYSRHIIRKITPAGLVRTFAGKINTPSHIDGVRGAATFNAPIGLGIDNGDNIYVAEAGSHYIRKITPDGIVTTIAGNGVAASLDNAVALDASFNAPYDVVMTSNGSLYVAEYSGHLLRKISSGGVVTTLAGSAGLSGDKDATGSSARFYNPGSITADSSDNLFVTDYGSHIIRKVTAAGVVTTATGSSGYPGVDDGPVYQALWSNPHGITITANASVLVADYTNNEVRKIANMVAGPNSPSGTSTLPSGTVSTFAGNGDVGTTDGNGVDANFSGPSGVDVDSSGNLFIADYSNHLIRKITPAGVVTTFAGSGSPGSTDDTGTAASFNNPIDLVIDSGDNVFVADYSTHIIRKITSGGVVTTFAGTASTSGSTDDTGAAARLNSPSGLGIDASNNIYVADAANHTIRKITTGAVVTTLAGTAGASGSDNGTGAAARFNTPWDVVVAGTGDLYVTDSGNKTIRKVTTGGVVTKLAGTTGVSAEKDATGTSAKFTNPSFITVDGNDDLFVTDATSHTLRKVTLAGVVTTPGGSDLYAGTDDGPVYASLYNAPKGIAVNSDCDIFVTDYSNQRIRKITDLASGCSAYRRRIILSYLQELFNLSKNKILINHQVQE